MRHRSGARTDQRGAGTVLVALVAGVVLVVFVLVALAGRIILVRDRAGVVADQAALAAATELNRLNDQVRRGSGTEAELARLGCPVADEVARRNGARLVGCAAGGDATEFIVTVTVEVDLGFRTAGLPSSVRRQATAGRSGQ